MSVDVFPRTEISIFTLKTSKRGYRSILYEETYQNMNILTRFSSLPNKNNYNLSLRYNRDKKVAQFYSHNQGT